MELQLKNIGMIKEANIAIDGLTVIAGENDTGKSTAAKALFFALKVINEVSSKKSITLGDTQEILNCTKVFNVDILQGKNINYLEKAEIKININGKFIDTKLALGTSFENIKSQLEDFDFVPDSMFIETPLVWNFTDFFRDIAQVESQMRIELDYPYLMKDLNFKLHIKSASNGLDIKERVTSLMGGEFKKDEMGRYYFDKQGKRIELINTATGIKYFGIFQILSQNNYLNKDTVLVLDEPEVHLHPKWQLEMAKIIVELVKNGVKVLVNSHSPYMIEALERYGEKSEINMDFYLAEDGMIDKVEDNNSKTLAQIFNKLSAPYETFNQMDSEILNGG